MHSALFPVNTRHVAFANTGFRSPECFHLFQQFDVARRNLKLLQPLHASCECLCCFIARLRLGCNEQPLVYARLLLLEAVGLLDGRSSVVIALSS